MAEGHIIIFITTAGVEEARRLAQALVNSKKVACVNIVPEVNSLYWWQDKVAEDKEALLLVKTQAKLFPEIMAQVKNLHPYQVPEIIALPIVAGNPEYLNWIDETTR